jgi:formyl-CoA transferase
MNEDHQGMGPLHGIKVIDMTSVLMGPFASQALGDMGADVVKVEAPAGDLVRQIGPGRHADMGPIFLNTNRNKRSLTLDLKKPAGLAVLRRLLVDADVLVYNVRPNAMARLGLDYDSVAAINPRLVYAGLFGFGQDGPYAARPAYDDLIQGGATLSSLIARASGGPPRYVPTAMADRIVGTTAVGGILASLVARQRTGRGDRVDVPMFETMVGFVLGDHLGGLSFEPPLDDGGYARQLSPERRPYRTRDGYLCAMVYNDKQWENFLRAIGRESLLATDPRFANFVNRSKNIDHVYGELARIFEERSTDEWMRLLEDADVPMLPMHDFKSVLKDPHLVATGFFAIEQHPSEGTIRTMRMPMRWLHNAPDTARPAPRQGEHSVELLREAGYATVQIEQLIADGVVQVATPRTTASA